jgi:uncharacterized protein
LREAGDAWHRYRSGKYSPVSRPVHRMQGLPSTILLACLFMNIELTALEARAIGCLIEKQITTPDQYPLSLNALTNACNQKSNRDPILDLDERAVQHVLDGLVRKHMVIERAGFGSRVPKYQQVFCNTEFGSLKFTPLETAIVCELLVRGPQTPGELRTRASRMSEVGDVSQVESALQNLMARPDGPFVTRLAREPARRDSRYAQLFCGVVVDTSTDAEPIRQHANTDDDDRLTRLEKLVDRLVTEVSGLKRRLDEE